MVASEPFIAYDFIKGSAFQPFRNGNKIENIWEDIKIFLNSCTTINREQPTYAELNIHEAFKVGEHKALPKKIIAEAKTIFGKGKFHPKTDHSPHHKYWEIDAIDLQKAVDFLIKGQPWPIYYFGPILLYITYHFKLVDPETKTELENQQYESILIVFLSGNCSCAPAMSFPFSKPGDKFKNYLSKINNHLPFNLETKYLKLVRSNKKGTRNYSRKLLIDT